MMTENLQIGMLLFPGVTQLDLTGPAEVFSASRRCDVHLIWKTLQPVETGAGWSINPTRTFAITPPLDVICVPGGTGQIELMDDDETLDFIRLQAAQASSSHRYAPVLWSWERPDYSRATVRPATGCPCRNWNCWVPSQSGNALYATAIVSPGQASPLALTSH